MNKIFKNLVILTVFALLAAVAAISCSDSGDNPNNIPVTPDNKSKTPELCVLEFDYPHTDGKKYTLIKFKADPEDTLYSFLKYVIYEDNSSSFIAFGPTLTPSRTKQGENTLDIDINDPISIISVNSDGCNKAFLLNQMDDFGLFKYIVNISISRKTGDKKYSDNKDSRPLTFEDRKMFMLESYRSSITEEDE
jgi:hypothetical protein